MKKIMSLILIITLTFGMYKCFAVTLITKTSENIYTIKHEKTNYTIEIILDKEYITDLMTETTETIYILTFYVYKMNETSMTIFYERFFEFDTYGYIKFLNYIEKLYSYQDYCILTIYGENDYNYIKITKYSWDIDEPWLNIDFTDNDGKNKGYDTTLTEEDLKTIINKY